MSSAAAVSSPSLDRPGFGSIWRRQLDRYPANGVRAFLLGIVVLATIILYYELYVGGAVATQIIADFGIDLKFYIYISVVGNAIGALSSLAAGLADRWGRANLVVYGLLITAVLVLFGLPASTNQYEFAAIFTVVGLVEGVILVATPALIRDFSPQLGRASAMGFWTLGPVIGSLVVTEVSSHTLDAHPDWQFQFRVCGIAGLVVFVIAFFGLRELSPRLRDQLMVSIKDRTLIEAKAAGVDLEAANKNHWKQMMKLDVVGSALAIALFLLFYYIAVGFFVIYFATNFGYTPQRANGLANWYWIANAVALVVTGVWSDALRVRKPFMVVGALISAVGVALFAIQSTRPDTGYYHFAWIILVISLGGGIAYAAWMASFTETVERHNPAGTATGLAIWGGLIRTVVTISLIGLTLVVTASSILVDKGPRAQEILAAHGKDIATLQKLSPDTAAKLSANPTDPAIGALAVSEIAKVPVADVAKASALGQKYATEIASLGAIDADTLGRLQRNPNDGIAQLKAVAFIKQKFGLTDAQATARLIAASKVPPADLAFLQTTGTKVQTAANDLTAAGKVPPDDLAFLQANGTAITKAQADSPHQWQKWWWVCFAGQILFLPFILIMTGRWSPKKARKDAADHEAAVARELAELQGSLGARQTAGSGSGGRPAPPDAT